ncbi:MULTISPECIES: hypothetical protein [Streptomyces]|uniref:Peptidase C39-like domain-containing protein n=1 Tax=Streptomyces solicathayae TaxID=3081768 RepID=A0ABZ0LZV0_9ACTN|nr:hypothetical protein [Streptomyces sp. HUAS YS2]WOX25045.1 hypothetical protein R2D22_28125 [Streptomyces sp. HUAS YS2]
MSSSPLTHASRTAAALLAAAALATTAASPAVAASAAEPAPGAAYKATHDTLAPQRLTAGQRALTAEKQADAARSYDRLRAAPPSTLGTLAGYKLSGGIHQSQKTSYWCGPATLVITQSARDEVAGRSQQDAATLLKTTTSGTAWYGININVPSPTGYPMADALNYRLPGSGYVPRALPYTPTATDKANFKAHITHNTDNDYGIAGNAWEVPGGPHLVGHPNIEIFHWVSIDGYNTDTAAGQVNYLDPVGGVSTSVISWAGSVPKSAHISSDTITTIMGGRGYVW